MEYGLIKDTTLTAIADGLRAKGVVPEGERVPTEVIESFKYKSSNATSLDDPTPTKRISAREITIVEVPEATSLELVFTFGKEPLPAGVYTNSYGGVSFKTIDDWPIHTDNIYINVESPLVQTRIVAMNAVQVIFSESADSAASLGMNFEVFPLDADGNRMQIVTDYEIVTNTVTPSEMVEAINNMMMSPPESAFIFTDLGNYLNYYGKWDAIIDTYKDYIQTKDITSLSYAFQQSTLKELPFEFKVKGLYSADACFKDMQYLEVSPKIRGTFKFTTSFSMADLLTNCYRLRYVDDLFEPEALEGYKTVKVTGTYSVPRNPRFQNCRSLRTIPKWFKEFKLNPESTAAPAGTYYLYYYTFNSCFSLDEIRDIPVWICQAPLTTNAFSYTFSSCARAKSITFETNNGQPIIANWKSQVIDIDVGTPLNIKDITGYNSGITEDKKVIDDATYQALKNDPDWFAGSMDYSRYNHDSAVETINSLPDTSAYLATAGGTNTIKFRKLAGSKTDAGAINTLTAEEIAVAAAKGWTVSLV